MSESPEARDWQGNPVQCAGCRHEGLLARGGCRPRWACVNDRYARRIDHFFARNPALASEYLAHPYFEVCAVASTHANRFHLKRLMEHPDETVRACVALRLPQRLLLKMRDDAEREVRILVAAALSLSRLAVMMHDPDYYVRMIVARRAGQSLLIRMIDDPDSEVRLEIARRLDEAKLPLMRGDADGRESNCCRAVPRRSAPQHASRRRLACAARSGAANQFRTSARNGGRPGRNRFRTRGGTVEWRDFRFRLHGFSGSRDSAGSF